MRLKNKVQQNKNATSKQILTVSNQWVEMNGAKWHLKNVGCESSLQQLLFWLITLKLFFINDDKQKLK